MIAVISGPSIIAHFIWEIAKAFGG